MSVRQLCLAQTTSCDVSDISSPRPESALGLGPWHTLLFLPDPHSLPSQVSISGPLCTVGQVVQCTSDTGCKNRRGGNLAGVRQALCPRAGWV